MNHAPARSITRFMTAAALTAALGGGAGAQEMEETARQAGGARLYSVSVFGGYYSDDFAGVFGGSGYLGADTLYGATAKMGWSRLRPASKLAVSYSPQFTLSRYDSHNSIQHALALVGSKKVSRRWTSSLALNASLDSTDQALFSPGVSSQLVSAPLVFADLVDAVLRRQYTNSELASILTGAAPLDAPTRSLLYGYRVLSSSISGNFSYAYSPRTNVIFQGTAYRYQYLPGKRSGSVSNMLGRTTSGGTSAEVTHMWSPRTSFGAKLSAERSFSSYQDAYYLVLEALFARTLTPRWIIQANGGTGVVRAVRKSSELPGGPLYQGGVSVVYKAVPHTLTASVNRRFTDRFAIGLTSSYSMGGAWQWSRPGSRWRFQANFHRHYYLGNLTGNIGSSQASAAIVRMLTNHTSLALEGVRMSYDRGSFLTDNPNLRDPRQEALRLVFTWTGGGARPR